MQVMWFIELAPGLGYGHAGRCGQALARVIRRCEGPARAGQPSVHGGRAAHLMGHLAVNGHRVNVVPSAAT
jgi:hypothetical protein